ncbi:hypothetical protein BJX64DRAFT_249241 [Aspergillus heterothallicus]
MRRTVNVEGKPLVPGRVSGRVLYSNSPLNFWTEVNHQTGTIVSSTHTLNGKNIKDHILAVTFDLGSYGVSLAILELLKNKCAPRGIILRDGGEATTAGVIIALTHFNEYIPVFRTAHRQDYTLLRTCRYACIGLDGLQAGPDPITNSLPLWPPRYDSIKLSASDRDMLNGEACGATKMAMEILSQFASAQGAPNLMDIGLVHIGGLSANSAGAAVLETLYDRGGRFCVNTTIGPASIYLQRWMELFAPATVVGILNDNAKTLDKMGATIIEPKEFEKKVPRMGSLASMGERHWRVFENSMRRGKWPIYPDLIDVCVAITGREPAVGDSTANWRMAEKLLRVVAPKKKFEDTYYLVLGCAVGRYCNHQIPLMEWTVEDPSESDVLSFAAGFVTTSSAPMFHIKGVTPDADKYFTEKLLGVNVEESYLLFARRVLTTAEDDTVRFVLLGNPIFSLDEFKILSALCDKGPKLDEVDFVITTDIDTYDKAESSGYLGSVNKFGAQVKVDEYWFNLAGSADESRLGNIMTNSTRYAHYPANKASRGVQFGSLRQCVEAARTGRVEGFEGSTPAPE